MSPGRAMRFSVSVIILAVSVALSTQSGPDSPRARGAGWLRAHGYPELADWLEPTAPPLPVIETLP